jgi:DNA-binding transcriptional LysR family regulator
MPRAIKELADDLGTLLLEHNQRDTRLMVAGEGLLADVRRLSLLRNSPKGSPLQPAPQRCTP